MNKEDFIKMYKKDKKEEIIEELFYKCNANYKYEEVLDKIRKNNTRIIDYGFDYDGFNNVENLKKLIDMLVDYARKNNELLEEID